MTRTQQHHPIREMYRDIAAHFKAAFEDGKIPENWGGLELRQHLVDYAKGFTPAPCSAWTSKRKKDFRAACYAKNL